MSFYRRPKFLEILHEIREGMSREADYDVDLFAEQVRSGKSSNLSSSNTPRITERKKKIINTLHLEKLPKSKK